MSGSSESPRVLVTGDSGFVGCHALSRWPGAVGLSSLGQDLDIRDRVRMRDSLCSFAPAAVLHLAAQSFVPESFRSPENTFDINFLGTHNLLQALSETGFSGRVIFVGTSDAYGVVPVTALPIHEELPLHPRNPYAVSKVAAEALCYQWSQTGSFELMMARPFNHIGPGQAPIFVISDFARQIAEMAAGKRPPVLQVGNIDVTRDFTDVSDVLRAYELLFSLGKNGEIYNICSGVERSVRSMIDMLVELSGVQVEIITDPTRFRPAEQARVVGSHKKLSDHTGWQPGVPMRETLKNIYEYWKREVDEQK